jgi:hypothetical protein
MSLRSSGFWCDICDKPMVTEMLLNQPIKSFTMQHFDAVFHYHEGCRPLLESAIASGDESGLNPGAPVADCIRQIKAHNARAALSPKPDDGGEGGVMGDESPKCGHADRKPWSCYCDWGPPSCASCHLHSECVTCGALLRLQPTTRSS